VIESPRRVAVAIAAVASALLVIWHRSADAEVYRNKEFGINVSVPHDLPTCSGATDQHDHGIAIYLDPSDARGCGVLEGRRSVSIFASYNVADETRTLTDYLNWTCHDVLKGQCVAAPKGLRIAGLPSAARQVNRSDGWIAVVVLAQGGRVPNQRPDDFTGAVNYSVTLRTDQAHLGDDLSKLEGLLRNLRLNPPK